MEIITIIFSILAIIISIFPFVREIIDKERPLLGLGIGWDTSCLEFHNSLSEKKLEPPNLCQPYIQITNYGLSNAFDIVLKYKNKNYYITKFIKPGESYKYYCSDNIDLFYNLLCCEYRYKTKYWPIAYKGRIIKR